MRGISLATAALLTGFLSLAAGNAFAEEANTDRMTDDQIRAYREKRVSELETRAAKTTHGGPYRQVFFCTLYYTPRESGFTEEGGYDMKPVAVESLGGRSYPRSFLRAVRLEGVGRLKTPVRGHNYIVHTPNGFRFYDVPLGSDGRPLIPKKSCAASSRKNHFLPRGARLLIESKAIARELGSSEWRVTDTGSGLHKLQIDLYWGEDDPRGPVGRNLARPKGTVFEYSFDVVVTVNPQQELKLRGMPIPQGF